MAKRREIDFTIDEQGRVSIQVKGVGGPECERLTREIELALGVVSSRQHTSEFYQTEEASQTVGTGDGKGGTPEG